MVFDFSSLSQKLSQLLSKASLLLLGTSAGVFLSAYGALASEEIVITYSALEQPVLVKDLETFVETGEMSSSIRFLVGISKQNPEDVRQALTKELDVSLRFLYKVLNTLPGEYALFQAGQVVHPKFKPNRAIIPALRGTLLVSASNDNKITLLEFFQKYPTQQMYIDGRLLKNTAEDVIVFINRAKDRLEVPLAIAKDFVEDMVCDCEVASSEKSTFTEVNSVSASK